MIHGHCGDRVKSKLTFLASFTFPNPNVNVRMLPVPTVEAYFNIFAHLSQILTFVYPKTGANFIQMQKMVA